MNEFGIITLSLFKIASIGFLMKWVLEAFFKLEIYSIPASKCRVWLKDWLKKYNLSFKSFKPYISIAVNIAVAFVFNLDMVAEIMNQDVYWLTILLTGMANGAGAGWFADLFKHGEQFREMKEKGWNNE